MWRECGVAFANFGGVRGRRERKRAALRVLVPALTIAAADSGHDFRRWISIQRFLKNRHDLDS